MKIDVDKFLCSLFAQKFFSKDETVKIINALNEQNFDYCDGEIKEIPQIYETDDGCIVTYSEEDGYVFTKSTYKPGDLLYHPESGTLFYIKSIEHGLYKDYKDNIITPGRIKEWKRWNITDAKDGDILISNEYIIIFKKIENNKILAYISYDRYNFCIINPNDKYLFDINGFVPTTIKQKNFLIQKIKDFGYLWDEKNKEIRKEEDVVGLKELGEIWDEKNFKEGDWITNGVKVFYVAECYIDTNLPQYSYYKLITPDNEVQTHVKSYIDNFFKYWNISNAIDGEVLRTEDGLPFIYNGKLTPEFYPYAYLGMDKNNKIYIVEDMSIQYWTSDKVKPATFEEKTKLFNALNDIGFKWDEDNKLLINIWQKENQEQEIIKLNIEKQDNQDKKIYTFTQYDIDKLIHDFKLGTENFNNKRVSDIYKQGILDFIELFNKKFDKELIKNLYKNENKS